jgi:hypothetical protein
MNYKLIADSEDILWTDDEGIIHNVPNEPMNKDWQEYQVWLAADPGNQPDPAD